MLTANAFIKIEDFNKRLDCHVVSLFNNDEARKDCWAIVSGRSEDEPDPETGVLLGEAYTNQAKWFNAGDCVILSHDPEGEWGANKPALRIFSQEPIDVEKILETYFWF